MNKQQHTPGPWKVDGSGMGVFTETGVNAAGFCPMVAGTAMADVSLQTACANARLIAAAPDQNKALHVAITVWRDVMGDMRCLVGAEAIIYKRMENALRVMEAAIAKAKEEA